MGLKFSVEELENKLSGMSNKLANENLDDILEKASVPGLIEMSKNVPKDTHELQGTLGIIKIEGRGAKRKIHLGSTSENRDIVERAYYQEYGHSRMAGTKWLTKSFNDSKDDAIKIISEELKKVFD